MNLTNLICILCVLASLVYQGSTDGFLLYTYTLPYAGYIYKANLKLESASLVGHPSLIIKTAHTPEAVTYDPISQQIFWSDTGYQKIFTAYINGSNIKGIVNSVRTLVALAVDNGARNLYWADYTRGRIEVARLDGAYRKVLVRIDSSLDLTGLVLDVKAREMYWSSYAGWPWYHQEMKIERSSMDGTNRKVIVSRNKKKSTGLAIDCEQRILYWAVKNSDEIYFVNLDNPSVTNHFKIASYHPFRLAHVSSRLYWTDRGTRVNRGEIGSVNTTTKTDIKILIDNIYYKPKDIYGYDDNRPHYGKTNCSTRNGECDHLCLQTPNGDRCVCSNGMTLKPDGKTCYFKEFLLVVDDRRQKIFHKSLDDLSHPKSAIPLGQTGYINTVDFDPLELRIYWTDNKGAISRALLNGSLIEKVVVGGNVYPRGHAIDVVGRNLYWYDSKNKEIGVSKLNGSYQKTLIALSRKPLAIALDSKQGYIYWGHWKTKIYYGSGDMEIKRSQMNGANQEDILTWNSIHSSTYDTMALAVDSANNRLYFHDGYDIKYTTTSRPITGKVYSVLSSWWLLYGLDVKEDYIYWGNDRNRAVYRANKTSSKKKKVVSGIYPMDLHVYHNNSDIPDDFHPCAEYNGWCTHLCLIKPGGYTCVCPSNTGSQICHTTPVIPSSSSKSILVTRSPSKTSSSSFLSSSVHLRPSSKVSASSSYSTMFATPFSTSPSPLLSSNSPSISLQLSSSFSFSSLAMSTPHPFLSQSSHSQFSSRSPSSTRIFTSSVSSFLPSSSYLPSSQPPHPQGKPSSTKPFSVSSSFQPSSTPNLFSSSLTTLSSSSFPLVAQKSSYFHTSPFSSSSSQKPTPSPKLSSSPVPHSSSLTPLLSSPSPQRPSPSSEKSSPSPSSSSLIQRLSSSSPRSSPSSSISPSPSRYLPPPPRSSQPLPRPSPSLPRSSTLSPPRSSPSLPRSSASSPRPSPSVPRFSTSPPPRYSPPLHRSSTLSPTSSFPLYRSPTLPPPRPSPSLPRTSTSSPLSSPSPPPRSSPSPSVVPVCPTGFYFRDCSIYIGDNMVSLQLKMYGKRWSESEFKLAVSQGSTKYCSSKPCATLLRSSSRVKRAAEIKQIGFKESDVLIAKGPSEFSPGEILLIQVALLNPQKTSKYAKVITKSNLCKLFVQAREMIEKYLEGPKIIKIDPSCEGLAGADKSKQQKDETSSGSQSVTIAMSVLFSILLLLVLIYLIVRYVRRKSLYGRRPTNGPHHFSFNNQGYLQDENIYEVIDPTFTTTEPISTDTRYQSLQNNEPRGYQHLESKTRSKLVVNLEEEGSHDYASIGPTTIHFNPCSSQHGKAVESGSRNQEYDQLHGGGRRGNMYDNVNNVNKGTGAQGPLDDYNHLQGFKGSRDNTFDENNKTDVKDAPSVSAQPRRSRRSRNKINDNNKINRGGGAEGDHSGHDHRSRSHRSVSPIYENNDIRGAAGAERNHHEYDHLSRSNRSRDHFYDNNNEISRDGGADRDHHGYNHRSSSDRSRDNDISSKGGTTERNHGSYDHLSRSDRSRDNIYDNEEISQGGANRDQHGYDHLSRTNRSRDNIHDDENKIRGGINRDHYGYDHLSRSKRSSDPIYDNDGTPSDHLESGLPIAKDLAVSRRNDTNNNQNRPVLHIDGAHDKEETII